MDADLARVARGQAVAPETEEAATQVLARRRRVTTIASAPTEIARRPVTVVPPPGRRYGPPTGYYEYDEPMRRRSIWPWLLAALLVAAAVVARLVRLHEDPGPAGRRRSRSPVPLVEGSIERLAVQKIEAAGLEGAACAGCRTTTVDVGRVFDQIPPPGERIDKGNPVVIVVSTRQAEGDRAGGGRANRRPTRSRR